MKFFEFIQKCLCLDAAKVTPSGGMLQKIIENCSGIQHDTSVSTNGYENNDKVRSE